MHDDIVIRLAPHLETNRERMLQAVADHIYKNANERGGSVCNVFGWGHWWEQKSPIKTPDLETMELAL